MKRAILCIVAAAALLTSSVEAFAQSPGAGDGSPGLRSTTSKDKKTKLKWLLKVLKKEPDVRQVQRAAAKYFELEPERVKKMARNARLKGLVPDLSASVNNRLGNEYRNTRDGLYPRLPNPADNPNPNNFKERVQARNDELTWSLSMHWSPDRLLFAAEALDAKSLTSLSENLIREITTMYYSRRRVMISLVLSPPEDPEEFLYELTRLDELTATIDAMTGGYFAKRAWQWDESDLFK